MRIDVEQTASRSLHDALWKDYGGNTLESEFVEATWQFSEEETKGMKGIFNKYIKKRRKDIGSYVLQLDLSDLTACVTELEILASFDIMGLAEIKNIDEEISKHFSYPRVWLKVLEKKKTGWRQKIFER